MGSIGSEVPACPALGHYLMLCHARRFLFCLPWGLPARSCVFCLSAFFLSLLTLRAPPHTLGVLHFRSATDMAFPLELKDEILSILLLIKPEGTPNHIATARQVCRLWKRRATPVLFEVFTIRESSATKEREVSQEVDAQSRRLRGWLSNQVAAVTRCISFRGRGCEYHRPAAPFLALMGLPS